MKLKLALQDCIWPRMLQRTLPAGFIAPCLPTKTDKLPSGSEWLHEIKQANGSCGRLVCSVWGVTDDHVKGVQRASR